MVSRLRVAAIVAIVLAIGFAFHLPIAAQSAAPSYYVTDLGVLPTGTTSSATSLNNRGEVAGYANVVVNWSGSNMLTTHAFRWKDSNRNRMSDLGEMVDLGTLPVAPGTITPDYSPPSSYAYGINDAGQVVGKSQTSDMVLLTSQDRLVATWQGFVHTPSALMQDVGQSLFTASLPVFAGQPDNGVIGINGSGEMLGWAWDYTSTLWSHVCGFVYSKGVVHELPYYSQALCPQPLDSGYSGARPVNNRSQVVAGGGSSPFVVLCGNSSGRDVTVCLLQQVVLHARAAVAEGKSLRLVTANSERANQAVQVIRMQSE